MDNSETKTSFNDYELQQLHEELQPYFEDVKISIGGDEKGKAHMLTRRGCEKFFCDKGVATMNDNHFELKRNRLYGKDSYEELDEKIRQWDDWRTKKKEVENLENFNQN